MVNQKHKVTETPGASRGYVRAVPSQTILGSKSRDTQTPKENQVPKWKVKSKVVRRVRERNKKQMRKSSKIQQSALNEKQERVMTDMISDATRDCVVEHQWKQMRKPELMGGARMHIECESRERLRNGEARKENCCSRPM